LLVLETLAVCYAADNRFEQAQETIRKALEPAAAEGNQRLIEHLQKQLQVYEQSGR